MAIILLGCGGCDQFASQAGSGPGGRNLGKQRATNVRNELLRQLQGLDEAAKLQKLLSIIENDQDVSKRRDALRFTIGLETKAAPIADSLARLFISESDAYVAGDIKQALVACEADVEESLLLAATDADANQLLRIVEALGVTSASGPEALEFFRKQLGKEDTELVMAACAALEQLGPAAQSLLPDLLSLAGRPRVPLDDASNNAPAFRASRDVTEGAVRAIAAIGADASAISVLTNCLEMEASIAAVAAKALANLGSAAATALPALQTLRNRDDHGGKDIKTRVAREAAADAIAAIAPGAN